MTEIDECYKFLQQASQSSWIDVVPDSDIIDSGNDGHALRLKIKYLHACDNCNTTRSQVLLAWQITRLVKYKQKTRQDFIQNILVAKG